MTTKKEGLSVQAYEELPPGVEYDPYVSPEEAERLGATKVELDDLLRRADQALYRAKACGRDRVEKAI